MDPTSSSNWRSDLKAAERYDHIERLRAAIEAKGLSSTGTSHKTAFAAENDAYNTSSSREAYEAACKTIYEEGYSEIENGKAQSDTIGYSGITIGQYSGCQHIASGLVSEVYRSTTVALKVITETRDVEPHNPAREVKILSEISHKHIIELVSTFKDDEGRLVLVFPYMPLTLAKVINSGAVPGSLTRSFFRDIFSALEYLHSHNIIHRDVKPSNVLLASATGPARLSDFGTSWHPTFSLRDEPVSHKVLEVGTTCYRAPETLFGYRSYDVSLDMWAAGAMLAECLRNPPKPLFESRETFEDGNQLGLILSIFKTIGTPTKDTWPEALHFSTPPFQWYQIFAGHSWDDLLIEVDSSGKDLVRGLIRYESVERLTASKVGDPNQR
ncbi:Protein kinase-like (PK-like) [Glarea lozoyensis ATCC 20868]|uniref:cyclin-dependent kinase n=1 Tax=Glarea lozoyensis (strain ATCC 20868 / MF5171) TaxID=1116229 RepID=S3D0N4_GLAL2|nr:Protein kinase-like (PK-like) [Glarea lozoyensis ATCC 20868]EPE31410.1 Protein kinase-like (PK-like) [Glarea lozoyensis ATCC 20868]